MQYYSSLSGRKTKKHKKILIAILAVLVVILLFLGIIGILRGSDGMERQSISVAIEENMQLKQQIEDLQWQIEQLQEEINAQSILQNAAEPTPIPESTAMPEGNGEIVQ